jgi:sugar phosphate isomerase/epimerase
MYLAYSTYGMKDLDIFEALPRLHDMGYQGMEIAVTPGWATEPSLMDRPARDRLAALFRQLNFPTPAIMALLSPCVEAELRPPMLAQFAASFDLARDLRVSDDIPTVGTTLGHPKPAWNTDKERIAELVTELADMAAERDVILCIEPHAGGDFETPEKAVWLMERTNHDHLKLNFDYSHFVVGDMDLQHCIDLNLPYAAHNHIKDGYRNQEGRVVYQLPGAGKLDMIVYLKAMHAAGWTGMICPEVTGQIWNRDDYDPWETAQFCYDALNKGLQALD